MQNDTELKPSSERLADKIKSECFDMGSHWGIAYNENDEKSFDGKDHAINLIGTHEAEIRNAAEQDGYEVGIRAALKSLDVRFISYFNKMNSVVGLLSEHEKSVICTVGDAQEAIRKLLLRNTLTTHHQ